MANKRPEDRTVRARLLIASQEGCVDAVKSSLSRFPQLVNVQDSYGCSLLALATKHGHRALVETLLQCSAKVDLPNNVMHNFAISDIGWTNSAAHCMREGTCPHSQGSA